MAATETGKASPPEDISAPAAAIRNGIIQRRLVGTRACSRRKRRVFERLPASRGTRAAQQRMAVRSQLRSERSSASLQRSRLEWCQQREGPNDRGTM
ncbi:hypothetical protein MRX96_032029 [Rhipicephalus microplus]